MATDDWNARKRELTRLRQEGRRCEVPSCGNSMLGFRINKRFCSGRCHNMGYNANKHNITIERYDELLQAGCANPSCGSLDKLSIDHDHNCCDTTYSCGLCVRGALCASCNAALGYVGDSKEKLTGLINYLHKGAN